jgi:chloramphenicol 3-O-phosphotransferase
MTDAAPAEATQGEREGLPGRRIIVVGPSCAGKTTLAERLAELLGVPFVELDALYWKPGWEESSDEEFVPRVMEATAGDGWVVAAPTIGRRSRRCGRARTLRCGLTCRCASSRGES